jgi:putative phosphoribosyl transferase
VAVPVAELTTGEEIAMEVDEFICPLRLLDFSSAGMWYVDFYQTTDLELCA